ncbi:SMP-30/gluconolactonase/LRE family protein [Leisingera sp. M527]|uniref:Gluconolactonase n=1 Tax=Phaeobacter inhibens TaxID=221822 RepID=A0ABN5GJQ1_9RHOB|nr:MULTISPECIES: SMP-30/gluconolactonase/LRE family protein [Roseobacteraceae]AUQ49088.1 Gluconolactonase [Phaeobacter inhibens]AUQ93588.1 Gluconolactonase [Phaeobacter inhibens]AUR18891.1 Gluconolactonase [Phaeobacter inhibens]UWQ33732.1 SMP-30/gluconolactonase/LRE family protein [Leisingera sp. M527]
MKRLIYSTAAIMLLLAGGGAATVSSLGAFNSVTTAYNGQCRSIGQMVGAEDIIADYDAGVAYISSFDRRTGMAGQEVTGALHRLVLDGSDQLVEMPLTGLDPSLPFLPHGMDLKTIDGVQYLFVLNHRSASDPQAGHDVYVFEVGVDALTLAKHHTSDGIKSPNGIGAVDLDTFYYSNDRGAFGAFGNMVEMMFARKISDLSVYDEGETEILEPMAFANGVATTPDGSTVYATALREGVVKVFARDQASNVLTLQREIPVGQAPDNVRIAEDGQLWVASHLNLMAFDGHIKDPTALSPFQVYRVEPDTGKSELVMENDGSLQSSVSVAVPYEDMLLIGSAFQPGVKICAQ